MSTIDWPSSAEALETVTIQCAGEAFHKFQARRSGQRSFLEDSSYAKAARAAMDEDATTVSTMTSKKKVRDLLALSTKKLKKLSYYQVLGDIPLHSTQDQIKRAYHKACLKYHPDKTGRGEEDEVFLLVKSAFDTLSDASKRRSYDSTVDFDESIPAAAAIGVVITDAEFYTLYGPVFERNLRFDQTRLSAMMEATPKDTSKNDGKKKKNKKNKKQNNNNGSSATPKLTECPPFGDDDTPVDEVNKFYDYWINFDSWRDFSLKAQDTTDHDVDAADSREEKRWMAKEIDRKAKAMKRDEMARINTLVERAMAADPRIVRERDRIANEKKRAADEKHDAQRRVELEQKLTEARLLKAQEAKEQEEKESKATAKIKKEGEKKLLRKAKQLLRKLTFAAFTLDTSKVWADMEDMNDDVELLCSKLTLDEITDLTEALGGAEAVEANNAPNLESLVDVKECAAETKAGASKTSFEALKRRNEIRSAAAKQEKAQKAAKATTPWTRDELSALAKAVKKYPPGGANRWDAIALFVNNLCKPDEPRSKEDCIEKYNQVAQNAAPPAL
eukprot:scaffold24753_cov33-Attheya_sp.AAC.1